jgi:integration host factor subunit alpha
MPNPVQSIKEHYPQDRLIKRDVVHEVQCRLVLSRRKATELVHTTLETITCMAASGKTLVIKGFGVFYTIERAATPGRNPRTGQEVEVAARKILKFRPAKTMKAIIARGAK